MGLEVNSKRLCCSQDVAQDVLILLRTQTWMSYTANGSIRELLAVGDVIVINTAGGSFDQASVQSVDKALDNASMWLRQSVASGYASHLHMSQDPDLAMLRERRNVEYQWCYQTCQTNANTP